MCEHPLNYFLQLLTISYIDAIRRKKREKKKKKKHKKQQQKQQHERPEIIKASFERKKGTVLEFVEECALCRPFLATSSLLHRTLIVQSLKHCTVFKLPCLKLISYVLVQ